MRPSESMTMMPSWTPSRPSRSPPRKRPATIRSRARAIARRKRRVALALALVLDQQHLAAQRADDLAALVADREDFLQHGRAANHRRGHLVADVAVEQHPKDERRLVARHGATDRHRQRVRARARAPAAPERRPPPGRSARANSTVSAWVRSASSGRWPATLSSRARSSATACGSVAVRLHWVRLTRLDGCRVRGCSDSTATMGPLSARGVQLDGCRARREAGAGPDQRQKHVGERRMRDRHRAPQHQDQDDQPDELTRTRSAKLDVERCSWRRGRRAFRRHTARCRKAARMYAELYGRAVVEDRFPDL